MKTSALAILAAIVLSSARPSSAELLHSWAAEGNANDSIGNADGTLSGATSFTDGYLGMGFGLDGIDSSVTFGSDAGNFGTSDFTIAFAIAGQAPAAVAQILSKRATCGFGSSWDFRIETNGDLGVELREDEVNTGTKTEVNVADGEFHSVVFTRAGSVVSAYVDGIRRSSFDAGFVADVSNEAELSLGDGPCVGGDTTIPFEGTIDELRIANTAEPYLLLGDFDCGDAALNGGVTANDALVTLKTAVGTGECPLCACDVNGVAGVTAPDALAILRSAVGQLASLACPACDF